MNLQHSMDSLILRSKIVKIFAWSFTGLSIILTANTAYQTFKPNEIVVVGGGGAPPIPIWPVIMVIAAVLFLISILGILISSLFWIHRAHSNLHDQNIEMKYSANWAVGSYFVPFANLIVPFRAMRELYNRSHNGVPELADATADDVSAWWICYLIGLFLTMGMLFQIAVDQFTNVAFVSPVLMNFALSSFASLTLIVAAIMLAKLTASITDAQNSLNYAGQAFD